MRMEFFLERGEMQKEERQRVAAEYRMEMGKYVGILVDRVCRVTRLMMSKRVFRGGRGV